MTRWFEAHTIARYGRYRQVEPTVVVEIAFDVIVRSQPPRVGLLACASRGSPRCGRDKSVDEIDTVETVTALYEGLQHGAELLVTAGARTVPAERRLTVRLSGTVAGVSFGACSTDRRRPSSTVTLTLYTDAFIVRGRVATRQRRVTDMLNRAEDRFLVRPRRGLDEFGTTA